MKKQILMAFVMLASIAANAQLGGFVNKVKNKVSSKVNQRVDNKVDKTIDESLDAAEGKSKATGAAESVETKTVGGEEMVGSAAKFDFVPGEQIIYADDFATDEMGELPVNWNTNGSGELTTLGKVPGNWLKLHKSFMYLSRNKGAFGENYTVEFDVVLQLKNNGWSYPEFLFGVFATKDEPNTDNSFLKHYTKYAAVVAELHPGEFKSSRITLRSLLEGRSYFNSNAKNYDALEKYYGRPVHVSVQVQKERMRIWMNQEKVFDAPKALPADVKMNQLFFQVGHTNYPEDQYGIYVSNIKVATGKPDTRHKLVEEGKFSTTGILFDVNAATIKPESNGVLKELADVLTKVPDIKIRIVGHTDSDGKDTDNLELSKKRAAAVKDALAKDFAIDASRMVTDGKGEAEGVADNKTKEGKAQNRRVEFIKL